MTNFWEYEPRDEYLRKKADAWTIEARKAAVNATTRRQVQSRGYDPSLAPSMPTALERPLASRAKIDEVVQPQKKGSGFLEKIGLSDIDQPWDVLRPVARLFEAEQKYISRPLAKNLYNAITAPIELIGDAPEYDELPEGVRFGAEIITSPSTWIGPGAVARLAKNAPRLAAGLPLVGVVSPGPGSRRALRYVVENFGAGIGAGAGLVVADELGLPPIVGQGLGGALGFQGGRKLVKDQIKLTTGNKLSIVNPSDQRVYHGTIHEYEGLPDPKHSGKNFPGTAKGVFVTLDPEEASSYATPKSYTPDAGIQTMPGGRVQALTLRRGTKLFDPTVDSPPQGYAQLSEKHPGIFTDGSDTFIGRLVTYESESVANNFIQALKKDGYKGIVNDYEIFLFNSDNLSFAYTTTPGQALLGDRTESNIDQLRVKLSQALDQPDLDTALKSDDDAMRSLSGQARGGRKTQFNRKMAKNLRESLKMEEVNQRIQAGTHTQDDLAKASAFLRAAGIEPPNYVPGAGTTSTTDLLDSMYSSPDSMFKPRGEADMIEYAAGHVSGTQRARQLLRDSKWIPPQFKAYLEKKGFSLWDGPIALDLREHLRFRAFANSFGNGAADYQRALVPRIQALLGEKNLTVAELVENYKTLDLTPEQLALVDQFTRPIGEILSFADRFGVENLPEFETLRGRFIPLQAVTELPLRHRVGARQPVQLPQQWETLSEAVESGTPLREFFDSLQALYTQVLTKSADNWLNAILVKHGKTMSELMEELPGGVGLAGESTKLTTLIEQSGRLRKEISRAVGSSESTNLKRGVFRFRDNPELQGLIDQAREAVGKKQKKARVAGLKAALANTDTVRKAMIAENKKLTSKITRLRGTIERGPGTGKRGTEMFPIEYNGRFYPPEARPLADLARGPRDPDIITKFNKFFHTPNL